MREFGQWRFDCNQEVTQAAYASAAQGGAAACGCNGCRNFVAARAQVLPEKFIALLETLGVDPSKEAEAYHNARLAPGRHDYGGWFHFVGVLHVTGDFPVVDFGNGFSAWLRHASAPSIETLRGKALVELEFHCEAVPWVLDEKEPE
jgi:hypothetical protein